MNNVRKSGTTSGKNSLAAYSMASDVVRNLPTRSVVTFASKRINANDIIPLLYGEGDWSTHAFICDAATRALAEGEIFYTQIAGLPALREVISEYMTGLYQRPVGDDRITITTGAIGAIHCAMQMLLSPGDNVIIFEPAWPNVRGPIHVTGADARSIRMDYGEDGWCIDLNYKVISTTSR